MNLWIDGRANHWRARKIVREKEGGSSGEREKERGGVGKETFTIKKVVVCM